MKDAIRQFELDNGRNIQLRRLHNSRLLLGGAHASVLSDPAVLMIYDLHMDESDNKMRLIDQLCGDQGFPLLTTQILFNEATAMTRDDYSDPRMEMTLRKIQDLVKKRSLGADDGVELCNVVKDVVNYPISRWQAFKRGAWDWTLGWMRTAFTNKWAWLRSVGDNQPYYMQWASYKIRDMNDDALHQFIFFHKKIANKADVDTNMFRRVIEFKYGSKYSYLRAKMNIKMFKSFYEDLQSKLDRYTLQSELNDGIDTNFTTDDMFRIQSLLEKIRNILRVIMILSKHMDSQSVSVELKKQVAELKKQKKRQAAAGSKPAPAVSRPSVVTAAPKASASALAMPKSLSPAEEKAVKDALATLKRLGVKYDM